MKQLLRRALKEPLVHFLLVGFLLFVVFNSFGTDGAAEASKRIVVNGDSLVAFLQLRSKTFAPESFEARFDSLPAQELQNAEGTASFQESSSLGSTF